MDTLGIDTQASGFMDQKKRAAPPSRHPAFHAEDLEQIAGYRTLSGLAIVGLLFGLAAPLCFAAPLLMIIPLVGAAVSLAALRRIADSDGALAGKWAGTIGLGLCVASAVATISNTQVARYLYSRQAREFGRQWIGLVLSGQLEHAFGLTVEGVRPPPQPEPGAPTPSQTPYESFSSRALVRSLVAAGESADVRFLGTLSTELQPYRQSVVKQEFEVTPNSSAATSGKSVKPVTATLTLHRSRMPGESSLRWLVEAYEDRDSLNSAQTQ
jgi:hypothetical protein